MDDEVVFVTTIDNPFDPDTEFDKWYQFDVQKGYNTCGLLARLCHDSEYLSDYENQTERSAAIDTICKWFPLTHRKIVKKVS